jgi:uncharacterized phage protein (TIGR02218 family)
MALVPIQDLRIDVNARSESWVDTGVSLADTDTLLIEAFGIVKFGHGSTDNSYPEGYYNDGLPHDTASPDDVAPVGAIDPSRLHATNTVPLGLAFCIRPYGETPDFATGGVTDALVLTWNAERQATIVPGVTGRLWAVFNDVSGSEDDNSGQFALHLTREAEEDTQPFPLGQVSPINFIPGGLLAIKQMAVQQTVNCWFIDIPGAPEFYTDWDTEIECPEYVEETGFAEDGSPLTSTTPAGTYLPFRGAAITNVPHTQGLNVEAPDVTVVNFDANKLRNGFYQDRHVEIFEVPLLASRAEREVLFIGTFGNVDYDDLGATIELTPYEECLNQSQGQTIGPLCDVGRVKGETFGRVRCLNALAGDGIDIADWTRGAAVDSVQSMSRITFTPATVETFDGFESDFPGSFGLIRGVTGANAGVTRDTKTFTASTGVLDLRRALPILPAPGDTFVLEAGCDKSLSGTQGCTFWNNVANFRGFPYVPGRKKVRAQYRS